MNRFIVRREKVAVLFREGMAVPCADPVATPFDSEQAALDAASTNGLRGVEIVPAPPAQPAPPPRPAFLKP